MIPPKLILMVSLPRSGKSTAARLMGHPIVNPDSIRLALHGSRFLPAAEPMVWTIAKYMVKALFLAGHTTVVLDSTNTTQKRRNEWLSDDWDLSLVHINTSEEECTRRAVKELDYAIIPIIKYMAEKFEAPAGLLHVKEGNL